MPTPTPTPMTAGRERRIMLAVAGATSTGVLPVFLIGSQAVRLRQDLSFDLAGLGAAIAVSWTVAALASAPMGRLAERFGGGRSLRAAAFLNAVMMLGIALLARSWLTMVAFVAVAGIGNALAQPAANLLTARTIPADRQGFAFAIKQSAVPLATLLGGVAVPTITVTLGWRWTFAAGAALAALAAVLVVREPDEHSPPSAEQIAGEPESGFPQGRIPRARLAPLWALSAGVGLGASAAVALSSFFVSSGVAAGLSEGSAGLLLTIGSVFGIAIRIRMGRRADRRPGDQLPVVTVMMVIGAVAFLALALANPGTYVLATPIAFGAGWAWPGLFNLSVVRAYPFAPGAATGITQTGTYLGGALGPLCFGAMVDRYSFAAAWPMSAGLMLAGAATMVLARKQLARNTA